MYQSGLSFELKRVTRGLASQIHPVFMLPPLATAIFGGFLTDTYTFRIGFVHLFAIFLAVYTAHVKDGYVDFYIRNEDNDHPLAKRECRVVLLVSSGLFLSCLIFLSVHAGIGGALITLPTWLIGYFHAPQLDTNPVTATIGYPLGIAISIISGYYVQIRSLTLEPVAFATVFLVLLSGVKVIDDAKDYDYDRSISKRTVAVVLGPPRARRTAFSLMGASMIGVAALTAIGVFPRGALLAVLAFVAVAATTRRADPELTTMLLIRGSYVFLALLFAAVWFRPFG